jgi:hypothetical protein
VPLIFLQQGSAKKNRRAKRGERSPVVSERSAIFRQNDVQKDQMKSNAKEIQLCPDYNP